MQTMDLASSVAGMSSVNKLKRKKITKASKGSEASNPVSCCGAGDKKCTIF